MELRRRDMSYYLAIFKIHKLNLYISFKSFDRMFIKLTRLMKIYKAILYIVICQVAGFMGSLFTAPAIDTWYAGLAKPSFNPYLFIVGKL